MIDLDIAYRIRAEMKAVVAANTRKPSAINPFILMRVMQRLHPSLSNAEAIHLAKRIYVCWGQLGLDYDEAPDRADGMKEWYPVMRDGRLQRVLCDDLSKDEFAAIVAGQQEQAEHLQAGRAATEEEMEFLGDAGMRDNPNMKLNDVFTALGLGDDPNLTVRKAMRIVEARKAGRGGER